MKKLFGLLVVLGLVLTSCDAFDDSKCRATVEAVYPKMEVYSLPGERYRYIVSDSTGTIIYVRVMGRSTDITSTNVIKKGK